MRGLASKALGAGLNAVLLNQRNCGDTDDLGPGLYHSGLIEDAAFVIRQLADTDGVNRVVVAGYSLGGNLALRLAGTTPPETLPQVKGVCAVSPVLELADCVSALERRSNIIYHWNFVRHLKRRMRRKNLHYPGRFDLSMLSGIGSVRQFDDVYTAPHFGFGTSANYYQRASAMRVVDRIQVPALVISAEDDPFVPGALFHDPRLTANPHITVVLTKHGGHCGFVEARKGRTDDGYWAERSIVKFARDVSDRDQWL
jgi:predicted alpha/beta-fold hydrolase